MDANPITAESAAAKAHVLGQEVVEVAKQCAQKITSENVTEAKQLAARLDKSLSSSSIPFDVLPALILEVEGIFRDCMEVSAKEVAELTETIVKDLRARREAVQQIQREAAKNLAEAHARCARLNEKLLTVQRDDQYLPVPAYFEVDEFGEVRLRLRGSFKVEKAK